jgi:hypothetical protein
VHAIKDEEVPYDFALKLVEKIESEDSSLVLIKGEGSSHSMESELALSTMRSM